MNKEQLQKGKQLAENIEKLEAQLEGWKVGDCFSYETISIYMKAKENITSRHLDKLQTKYIDFSVVKAIAISRIEKELNELKTEFEKL